MVILDLIWEGYLDYLRKCCCEILPVEPIEAPWEAMRGKWNRYELVLTKLRVFQLGRFGLKKIVLMDADMLVLQNIDELFWMPAPAAVALPGALLGGSARPKMSAGLMVIEPSEHEFASIMQRLGRWIVDARDEDVLPFIEQDLLDMHWQTEDGGTKYTVLPFIYNLYPNMLDTLPFLAPESGASSSSFPLDHGVKVVHFWHWYNPMLATVASARQAMQLNARLKHKHLWYWYELWWELHQVGMARAVPEKYPIWREQCVVQNTGRFGSYHASKFVPIFQAGGGRCAHIYGGLGW